MTVYEEADAMAASFADRLTALLNGDLVGLYLVGSYALGDLQRDSDVDFMAVLANPLVPAIVEELRALHASMSSSYPGRPFEGLYVEADDLRRHPDTSSSRGLQYLAGELKGVTGSRLIEWEMLRRDGHLVSGLPIANLDVVDLSTKVPGFCRQNLKEYWARWLERTAPYLMRGGADDPDGRQAAWAAAWCALGIPRLYVAIADGDIVSKSEAGRRVRSRFDGQWWPVIDRALSYRELGDVESIRDLAELRDQAVRFSERVLDVALALPS